MKKVFFQLLILTLAVSIAAQEESVNEEIPKVIISNIKWSHKVDWKVFERSDFPTNSSNPNAINSTTMTVQKRNYFIYKASIKNETERNVKAFNYDLVFFRKETSKEVGRLEFSYYRLLKKNKKISTEGYGGPPTKLVDANEADNPTTSYNVSAEIKCVMYEDNSIWRRQGLAENACEELKNFILKREKEQSKFRF